MGIADGAPGEGRHAGLRHVIVDGDVGHLIGQLRRALDRQRVDAVPDHHAEERALDEGLAHERVLPAGDIALVVDRAAHLVHEHRPVIARLDVVLAGIGELDRMLLAAGFEDHGGIDVEIGDEIAAPAEAAAGKERRDRHVLRRDAERLRDPALLDRLHLGARGDVILAVADLFDDVIERLHAGMGEIGKDEGRLEGLGGAADCVRGIALFLDRSARFLGRFDVIGDDLVASAHFCLGIIPFDDESVPALLRGIGVGREHGDALGILDHIDHPLDRLGSGRIERLHLAAEPRRPGRNGGQHVRLEDVDRIGGLAVGFGEGIDLFRDSRPDQGVILGILEGHHVRNRQLGRGLGEGAEVGFAGRSLVHDLALRDGDLARRHLPFGGGGLNQHVPGVGADFTILLPGVRDAAGAAGALHTELEMEIDLRIDRGGFGPHLAPIGVKLLGDKGGEAGIDALAHLGMLGDHRHRIVRRDAQEEIRGGGRRGAHRELGERALQGHIEADHQSGAGGRHAFEHGAAVGRAAKIDHLVHRVSPEAWPAEARRLSISLEA